MGRENLMLRQLVSFTEFLTNLMLYIAATAFCLFTRNEIENILFPRLGELKIGYSAPT